MYFTVTPVAERTSIAWTYVAKEYENIPDEETQQFEDMLGTLFLCWPFWEKYLRLSETQPEHLLHSRFSIRGQANGATGGMAFEPL
jgi:hypothetical protein